MSKRKADIEDMQKQMRSLRKKLKKLTRAESEEATKPRAATASRAATEEVRTPRGRTAQGTEPPAEVVSDMKNKVFAVTSEKLSTADETENEPRSNSSTSEEGSDTEQESRTDIENTEENAAETIVKLSNETRERLCLKAEPAQSDNIALHPALIAEWNIWLRKGLYEGDEEEDKKREEKENELRDEIMKKFPRKGGLHAEAPKLNQEILAYMSSTAKNRDKHFVSAQNALGSAMIAVAKSISLILELEEDDISSMLTHLLGNAGKLLAGLHYQHSVMRRAFILPGIDEKYRELLKKSEITEDLFGEDLFKRLKHTKSLDKVVEDLAPRQHSKRPLKTPNWGNRKSLPMRPRGVAQQARKGAPQKSLRYKDRQRYSQGNKHALSRPTRQNHHAR
ncbi:uncharacterized protein LOC118648061 [Monomorium pharaonis]|uniref:uncharacterized protein LOC118648061 n=1 Tax=Monomorium pharaonis TaxID=307658 RepID=UPI0017474CDB|nr:uncharacterized protein LOC118648061 [Monomorium pharaonis]XP_036150162.1 uncharacterized protein LOC118648061 [Monomorium pharaonis]